MVDVAVIDLDGFVISFAEFGVFIFKITDEEAKLADVAADELNDIVNVAVGDAAGFVGKAGAGYQTIVAGSFISEAAEHFGGDVVWLKTGHFEKWCNGIGNGGDDADDLAVFEARDIATAIADSQSEIGIANTVGIGGDGSADGTGIGSYALFECVFIDNNTFSFLFLNRNKRFEGAEIVEKE